MSEQPEPLKISSKTTLWGINWTSESMLLAAIPVVSYFVAYSYEKSYCKEFAIPDYLADINISTIFTIIVILSTAYFTSFSILTNAVLPVMRKIQQRVVLYYTYWFGLAALIAFFNWQVAILTCAVIVFIFLCDLKQAKDNNDKLEFPLMQRLRLRKGAINRPKLSTVIKEDMKIGTVTTAVAAICFIYYVSSLLGTAASRMQVSFLVLSSNPSLILMNIKDGKAICSEYDPATNKLLKHLVIVPLGESNPTKFVEKNLGSLKF